MISSRSDKKTILVKVKPHKPKLIHLLETPRRAAVCFQRRSAQMISLNVFESLTSAGAAGTPEVRGVQLALKGGWVTWGEG